MNKFYTLLVATLTSTLIYGQGKNKIGLVVDALTGEPIRDVIIDVDENRHTRSNHLGYFQLDISAGDTLILAHDKYENESIVVPESSRFKLAISLKERQLDISGGVHIFYKDLAKNLRFPSKAYDKKIREFTIVEFKIDSLGASNIIAIHGDNDNIFERDIKKAFKKISGRWSQKYADKTFILPIVFQLNGYDRPVPEPHEFDQLTHDRSLSPIIVSR